MIEREYDERFRSCSQRSVVIFLALIHRIVFGHPMHLVRPGAEVVFVGSRSTKSCKLEAG